MTKSEKKCCPALLKFGLFCAHARTVAVTKNSYVRWFCISLDIVTLDGD